MSNFPSGQLARLLHKSGDVYLDLNLCPEERCLHRRLDPERQKQRARPRRRTWKGGTCVSFSTGKWHRQPAYAKQGCRKHTHTYSHRIRVRLSPSEHTTSEKHCSRGEMGQKQGRLTKWKVLISFFLYITPPSPPIARYILAAPAWSNGTTSSFRRENAGSISGRRGWVSSESPGFSSTMT